MEREQASETQEHWMHVAQGARLALAGALGRLAEMSGEDARAFVLALRETIQLELDAATFDESVEEQRARLERQAAYGG